MNISFNELNKRLADSDPQVRLAVAALYEHQLELQKQFDQMLTTFVGFASVLERFDLMNRETMSQMKELHRAMRGVDVKSESVLE